MASLSFIKTNTLADLLRSADPEKRMYVRVLSSTRLAVGADPLQPTNVIDLSKEAIGPIAIVDAQPNGATGEQEAVRDDSRKATRRSGDYWFELLGKQTACRSLKDLLSGGLKALEILKPGTLDNLSRLRGRSRRIVARDANQLFDKPHLVKEYAEPLGNGWYFGTNNSARETNVWLQRAAECAGLKPSTFRTSIE